jgi:hypothetical protein
VEDLGACLDFCTATARHAVVHGTYTRSRRNPRLYTIH